MSDNKNCFCYNLDNPRGYKDREDEKKPPNSINCYRCNRPGHLARDCPSDVRCHKCDATGHVARDCRGPETKCYKCGGTGHISYNCKK